MINQAPPLLIETFQRINVDFHQVSDAVFNSLSSSFFPNIRLRSRAFNATENEGERGNVVSSPRFNQAEKEREIPSEEGKNQNLRGDFSIFEFPENYYYYPNRTGKNN